MDSASVTKAGEARRVYEACRVLLAEELQIALRRDTGSLRAGARVPFSLIDDWQLNRDG